jgi:flagellar biosynthesis protein FlhG
MSRKTTTEWLQEHHSESSISFAYPTRVKRKFAKTLAVSSGKGGVGKTSIAIKTAKMLVARGEKVLLIDCDYNLSNTAVKLGFPIQNNFYELLSSKKSFHEAIHRDGDFHLLSACNGNMDLFDEELSLENVIFDIINCHKEDYDTIVLDCPAGLTKEVCNLNAYCDHRFIVVTPDKSSITDSYSLIKVLSKRMNIRDYQLIFNKVSGKKQIERLTKTFLETAELYLDCRLQVLGSIPFYRENVDRFDRELLKIADSEIHNSFHKVIDRFTEEDIGTSAAFSPHWGKESFSMADREQEVPSL